MNKYYTIGQLKELIKNLSDDTPIVSENLTDKIRTAVDLNIVDINTSKYSGDILLLTVGLFDIETNKQVNIKAD